MDFHLPSMSQNFKPLRQTLSALTLSVLAVVVTAASWDPPAATRPVAAEQAGEVAERERERYMPVPGGEAGETAELARLEEHWNDRLTYPTGRFDPAWVRLAALKDQLIPRGVPVGLPLLGRRQAAIEAGAKPASAQEAALAAAATSFVALGPKPQRMTGCSGCYDYTTTQGRINTIVIDPTTITNGSIVAYAGSDGGGVWKTTNCCSAATSWSVTTDDPAIATISISSLTIDPSDHNTLYAGTGDLNFGSFSMGSQGILKTTDAGAHWTTVGADLFGPGLLQPAGKFPQYDAVGKVRVDPGNGRNVVAGTKRGLYFSYDAGANWTGPCLTNPYSDMRQDVTGLELTRVAGVTRILAAVGVRGYATPVQFNLDQNGANGMYRATMPLAGCPVFTPITTNANGWTALNATSGTKYGGEGVGNQVGRIDMVVAPSNANVVYAQVQAITPQDSCGGAQGCQLGIYRTTNGGTSWTLVPGSDGASLLDCEAMSGDNAQNWYDQGLAVDPNNPDRLFADAIDIWFWQDQFPALDPDPIGVLNNLTCGYNTVNANVHVDQHVLTFVPGNSSILLAGNDGGVHGTIGADTASAVTDPAWFNMDTGFNTIEFYAGDVSGNFATSANPQVVAGAQDNGASSAMFTGFPAGPVQWQMGLGGDGFSGQIDPLGTGTGGQLRYWQGNNSGGISRCVSNCTQPNATWTNVKGGWGSDTQSFILPINLFHGGIPGGDDCAPAGVPGGCGHLLAGTTRVWESIAGGNATMPAASWYVTNDPATQNLTKQALGNRSYINQVKYSPKYQSVAIAGTNDGNVQIGFNLGTGVANQARWVDVTGGNDPLPNRPILGVALAPDASAPGLPTGYAAVGGFNANSPTTPGHVFQVTCTADCAAFTWLNKTGNLPDIPADSIIVNPKNTRQVFAGTDFGVYYTDDITATTPSWKRFENGLPQAMVWDMAIDRGSTVLAVFTRSRGAYVWPLPEAPVNTPPLAVLAATPESGAAPLDVGFDGAGSSDPDADAIASYRFDFGDGSPAIVQLGATITHRYTAAGTYTATLAVTDSRGVSSPTVQKLIQVVADAFRPFTFVERTKVAVNSFITSELVTMAGFGGSLPVSGSEGLQYSINGGPFTNAPGQILAGDKLAVRHVSAKTENTETVSTITVGSYSTPFRTVTTTLDRVPDAFDFGRKDGQAPGAVVASDAIVLQRYDVATIVAGPGVEYSQAGGPWTRANGTLQPGQTLAVRHTSNSAQLGYTKSTLTVGGVKGTFTTRTR